MTAARSAGAIRAFLDMMAAERGASPHTLDAYRRDLDGYATTLASRGRGPLDAEAEDVRAHLAALAGQGLSAASAARHLSAMRQLHKFLYLEGYRGDDPTAGITGARRSRAVPDVLAVAEVTRLLDRAAEEAAAAEGPERLNAWRRLALLEIAYATGLRVTELVTLPAAAVRAGEMVLVRGKGQRERLVPLGRPARAALDRWLAARAEAGLGHTASLFPARNGQPMARQVFARELKALAARAGLNPARLSPHGLRHAFASHLLQHGADIRTVQQLLGHADLATTQIYTHVLDERAQAMVRDLHPLGDPDERG